jgi:hypothetical protein
MARDYSVPDRDAASLTMLDGGADRGGLVSTKVAAAAAGDGVEQLIETCPNEPDPSDVYGIVCR